MKPLEHIIQLKMRYWVYVIKRTNIILYNENGRDATSSVTPYNLRRNTGTQRRFN